MSQCVAQLAAKPHRKLPAIDSSSAARRPRVSASQPHRCDDTTIPAITLHSLDYLSCHVDYTNYERGFGLTWVHPRVRWSLDPLC